jgi:hypothetical protein
MGDEACLINLDSELFSAEEPSPKYTVQNTCMAQKTEKTCASNDGPCSWISEQGTGSCHDDDFIEKVKEMKERTGAKSEESIQAFFSNYWQYRALYQMEIARKNAYKMYPDDAAKEPTQNVDENRKYNTKNKNGTWTKQAVRKSLSGGGTKEQKAAEKEYLAKEKRRVQKEKKILNTKTWTNTKTTSSSPWMEHVAQFRLDHPNMKGNIMKNAAKTYNK